ncbi:hypothetical protein BLS_003999 [Venturia inaequalis]|uniref:Arylsulfatase n=1 Tax=Venturia inaequalis TaxID=5025 RepID=A0A8H3ZG97_VENIN|nr:hypothetical protein EG328_011047 [Venturia inaequalis]KAE9983629.1 hypothetical protein BLS_003999 [Venturia inaequalis]KAE9992187.1 hypothetical protein EG327_009800 [Venturia inaequalis]RDI85086.1 hypothetical protein Vi05172_g5085 [Venturia inaequalis]
MRLTPFLIPLFATSVVGQLNASDDPAKNHGKRPNIVFILTDDQDVHLHSMDYLPLIKKHLRDQGTSFTNHYCTVNVTDVSPPYGGYPKFISQGLNDNHLPVWLQSHGYNTYYTGKLFNYHDITNYNSPYVNGFTSSDFLLDPYTYNYENPAFQHNKDAPILHNGTYSTDLVANKTFAFLEEATKAEKPFFLVAAPIAPHSNGRPPFTVPISADRHKDLFKDVRVPRTANFNPSVPSGASWVKRLSQQNESVVEYNDEFYRLRLRSLQAVDELVDGVFERLERLGLLENTYVIYSSDNGFHIGQHRLQPGKTCAYEEDINVPLIIRGPGVSRNRTTNLVTTHTDLSPTILHLTGAAPRPDFDGSPIPIHGSEIDSFVSSKDKVREHVNVEFWGLGIGEGTFAGAKVQNNTYKSVRVIGGEGKGAYSLSYTVWCEGDHELYNVLVDPGQMVNLLAANSTAERLIPGLGSVARVTARLDALLLVLKSCKGSSCRRPWASLHPNGGVQTLGDAMAERFDAFYVEKQAKVGFSRCELGYLIDAEGAQFENDGEVYRDLMMRDGAEWSEWV